MEAWRAVFFIATAIYVLSAIFYGICGSGELQCWAMPPQSAKDAEVELNASPVEKKKPDDTSTHKRRCSDTSTGSNNSVEYLTSL